MMLLRFGRKAVYQGKEYDLLHYSVKTDEYVIATESENQEEGNPGSRTVARADLEHAYQISNKCIYQGDEAQIDGQAGGRFQMSRRTEAGGFLPIDWEVYAKEVPVGDQAIGRIWEEQQPLDGFEGKEAIVIIKE